jgi:hypothetical protein
VHPEIGDLGQPPIREAVPYAPESLVEDVPRPGRQRCHVEVEGHRFGQREAAPAGQAFERGQHLDGIAGLEVQPRLLECRRQGGLDLSRDIRQVNQRIAVP